MSVLLHGKTSAICIKVQHIMYKLATSNEATLKTARPQRDGGRQREIAYTGNYLIVLVFQRDGPRVFGVPFNSYLVTVLFTLGGEDEQRRVERNRHTEAL